MNNFLKVTLIGLSLLLSSCKDDAKNDTLKIGKITKIKLDEVVENSQHDLSLQVKNINDSRCPEGVQCVWEGNASVEFILTTRTESYNFTLDTHTPPNFKNDTIIEGLKYHLIDVVPYPVFGKEQVKVVKILVGE